MTDFTNSIERTAASIEDLQEDLEAHLEDILDVDVGDTETKLYGPDEDYPAEFCLDVELAGLEDELEERLGGDVSTMGFKIYVVPGQDGDLE